MKTIFEILHNDGHNIIPLITTNDTNSISYEYCLYSSEDFTISLLLLWNINYEYSYLKFDFIKSGINHVIMYKLPDIVIQQFEPQYKSFAKLSFDLSSGKLITQPVEMYNEPDDMILTYDDSYLYLILDEIAFQFSIENNWPIKQLIIDRYLNEIDNDNVESLISGCTLTLLEFKSFIQSVSVD